MRVPRTARFAVPALLFAAALTGIAFSRVGFDAASALAAARAFAAARPALAAAGFSLVYVAAAALGVPVVAAMSVAAGALFGLWLGLPLAIASSATGATLAMLMVRYGLRDRIAAGFPQLSAKLDVADGAGAAILFAARMTPFVPFALVNDAVGMSRMPARTFALVSAAGAAPLAAAYVAAGATLGAAARPADALSPGLLAALALAGLITVVARAGAIRRSTSTGSPPGRPAEGNADIAGLTP